MTEVRPRTLSAVHFAELPDAQRINRRLIEAYVRENDAPDVRRTHMFAGRYENTYIPVDRLPELAPVSDFALRTAERILQQRGLRQGFWFNEMPPGSRTTLHSHEEIDELLSAVYYVQCAQDSGRLVLHDPEAQVSITPRPGLLVLFPPDLPHEVEENASPTMRLSVAFNFGPSNSAT
jgi:uncharacterized RmlC-like cupin family protein